MLTRHHCCSGPDAAQPATLDRSLELDAVQVLCNRLGNHPKAQACARTQPLTTQRKILVRGGAVKMIKRTAFAALMTP